MEGKGQIQRNEEHQPEIKAAAAAKSSVSLFLSIESLLKKKFESLLVRPNNDNHKKKASCSRLNPDESGVFVIFRRSSPFMAFSRGSQCGGILQWIQKIIPRFHGAEAAISNVHAQIVREERRKRCRLKRGGAVTAPGSARRPGPCSPNSQRR